MEKKEIKRLAIKLDAGSPVPIYEQIKQHIKLAILSGDLKAGEQVTPIRDLATQLRVNPNTIVKVYYQLEVEGYLKAQIGSGIFVFHDSHRSADDSRTLFRRLTDDYLAGAIRLGFSLQQIMEELSRRKSKTEGSIPGGERP